MSRFYTRFSDALLARFVPQHEAHAQQRQCPGPFTRFCRCEGDRMYEQRCEYYYAPGGHCLITCGNCRITRTC